MSCLGSLNSADYSAETPAAQAKAASPCFGMRTIARNRQVVGPHPDHAAIRSGGSLVLFEVPLLGVVQLPQVNGARLVRIELQLRQVIGHAVGRSLKADARDVLRPASSCTSASVTFVPQ